VSVLCVGILGSLLAQRMSGGTCRKDGPAKVCEGLQDACGLLVLQRRRIYGWHSNRDLLSLNSSHSRSERVLTDFTACAEGRASVHLGLCS
jgi:hypothetical protein